MTYPKKVHMERVSFTHPKPLPPLKTTFRKKGKSSHFITSITGHTTVHYSFRQLEYTEQTM